jgi:predicted membrane channel-forming protein YqfA (hemolysin III family)
MGMSGGDVGQPTSVAIAGMGIAGGCSLLILASVTVCLAIGVLKLREWAWIVSIASNAVGIGCTILSLFATKEYRVLPLVPSIVFHLLVVSTGVWMLAYLLLHRVKQAFSAAAA